MVPPQPLTPSAAYDPLGKNPVGAPDNSSSTESSVDGARCRKDFNADGKHDGEQDDKDCGRVAVVVAEILQHIAHVVH